MESGPKRTRKEAPPDYKNMNPDEFALNMLYEFLKMRNKKPEAWKRAKNIQKLRQKREKREAKEARKQLKEDERIERQKAEQIAQALGEVNLAVIENKKILDGGEKNAARAVWTMLWSWPIIRSANKYQRRKEAAKKTLLEPFTLKSLGDLFKHIGSGMIKM